MSPNRCEQFVARTALLVGMLEGALAQGVSEAVKEEIRRVLHYVEPPPIEAVLPLGEADE